MWNLEKMDGDGASTVAIGERWTREPGLLAWPMPSATGAMNALVAFQIYQAAYERALAACRPSAYEIAQRACRN